MIYAAEHYATALVEKAAQLDSLKLPRTLVYVRIEIPDGSPVEELPLEALRGWDAEHKHESQQFGDRWYDEQRSLALIVPSLAAPGLERNVLINQRHPLFARVKATRAAALVCHPRLLE